MDFTFDLSSDSLAVIAALTGKASKMKNVNAAGVKALGEKIASSIPDHMHWKNPTPRLSLSFSFRGNEVGSDLPYARRREFSFKGPDSLGRMFPNDPAAYYMKATLDDLTEEEVLQSFTDQLKILFG